MAASQLAEVIQHLRRTVLLRDGAGLTDGQLLEDYISSRDDAALAALVRRHGPMVWGVCRRVLHNYHDAEGAFQATFLVLVRKAASIAARELLTNWLYGVAHQTASKARSTIAKRQARERQVTGMVEPAVIEPCLWNDVQPLLDQELSRLPDNYRGVIVLCDLEGKTRKEAARQLGLPDGTVGSRLARARAMLAKRLARHGVVVSGGALAAALTQSAASASVPTSVVSSTIKAAKLLAAGHAARAISANVAALTEGVLKAMLMTKLKIATAVVLIVGALLTGIGTLTHLAMAGGREPKSDQDILQGTWTIVSAEIGGRKASADEIQQTDPKLIVNGDKFSVQEKGRPTTEGSFKLHVKSKPKSVEVTEHGGKSIGIYELEGDDLKICLGDKQPKSFATQAGSNDILLVCKRVPVVSKQDLVKKETAKLRGKWKIAFAIVEGRKATDKEIGEWSQTFTFLDDKFTIMSSGQTTPGEAAYKLDPTVTPKAIDITPAEGPDKGKILLCIYQLEEDTLTLCEAAPGIERPKDFSAAAGSQRILKVYKREKP